MKIIWEIISSVSFDWFMYLAVRTLTSITLTGVKVQTGLIIFWSGIIYQVQGLEMVSNILVLFWQLSEWTLNWHYDEVFSLLRIRGHWYLGFVEVTDDIDWWSLFTKDNILTHLKAACPPMMCLYCYNHYIFASNAPLCVALCHGSTYTLH